MIDFFVYNTVGIFALIAVVFFAVKSYTVLIVVQQEEYDCFRVLKRLLRFGFAFEVGLLFLLHYFLLTFFWWLIFEFVNTFDFLHYYYYCLWVLGAFLLGTTLYRAWVLLHAQYKKPLKITARIIFTFLVANFIFVSIFYTLNYFFQLTGLSFVLAYMGFPLIIFASCIAFYPVTFGYKKILAKKIKNLRTNNSFEVIGVAGSFGKTSVKHYLGSMLSVGQKVLVSKESYNTFFGVLKFLINNFDKHEVYIAEMGVYKQGEIKEICKTLVPSDAIITAIGFEHFERFTSIERIKAANFELVENSNGNIVINTDNEYGQDLYKAAKDLGKNVFSYSSKTGDDAWFENVNIVDGITVFDVVFKSGERHTFNTRLLGKLNLINLTGCILLTRLRGDVDDGVKTAVENIEAVPHRLQLIKSNGLSIIDDAYNSNKDGFIEALNVLKSMVSQKKILVTPGMVELGAMDEVFHKDVMLLASQICDYIIIVGRYNRNVLSGALRDARYDEDKMFLVDSLEEAQDVLKNISSKGDAILFENDLPDIYE